MKCNKLFKKSVNYFVTKNRVIFEVSIIHLETIVMLQEIIITHNLKKEN